LKEEGSNFFLQQKLYACVLMKCAIQPLRVG